MTRQPGDRPTGRIGDRTSGARKCDILEDVDVDRLKR
jgi:hypothetical protein